MGCSYGGRLLREERRGKGGVEREGRGGEGREGRWEEREGKENVCNLHNE